MTSCHSSNSCTEKDRKSSLNRGRYVRVYGILCSCRWRDNPVNAWVGGNRAAATSPFFRVEDGRFSLGQPLSAQESLVAEGLLQELAAYRLASYEVRRPVVAVASNVIPFTPKQRAEVELPYFPNLKIWWATPARRRG